MEFVVQDAQREKLIGAINIMGPSGSGKTYASLVLAFGMMKAKHSDLTDEELWQKVGFLDTEHRRALIYANREVAGFHIGTFKYLNLSAPYTVDRYVKAALALKEAGVEVLIIDSLSHAWESDGGLLDLQQEKGGNFQAWRKVNPTYNNLIRLATGDGTGLHTINTMRSKQKHEMTEDDDGRIKVVKLGLQPVMRDSMEYEFQVSLSLDMQHKFSVSKDNTGIFHGRYDYITVDDGIRLYQFLEEGVDVKAEERKKRLEMLEYINTLRKNHEIIDFEANELEQKAKMTLAEMIEHRQQWFDAAFNKLSKKAEELTVESGSK